MFRPIVCLKTIVVIKILFEHWILMLSSIIEFQKYLVFKMVKNKSSSNIEKKENPFLLILKFVYNYVY